MGRFPFLNVVMELVSILNESRKLFLKNKKMFMLSVLIFSLLLNCFDYSKKFVGSLYIFIVVSFIINLYFVLVIVHASALTLKNENIKNKYFLVLTLKSWKRLLVTHFYIALYILGYGLFVGIILSPLFLFSSKVYSIAAKSVTSSITFKVCEFYLAIVWNLATVISILEETYGIKALRKAAKIVKGKKPKLFLLNFFFHLLSFGLAHILRLVIRRRSFSVAFTIGFVFHYLFFAVRMFQHMTYTIVYIQSKSLQGKDVESLMG